MLNFVTSLLPCIYLLAAICPALGTPNGQDSYEPSASDGNLYTVGTSASLTCNEGYYRGVQRETTCQASGNWTEPLPMCYDSNENKIKFNSTNTPVQLIKPIC